MYRFIAYKRLIYWNHFSRSRYCILLRDAIINIKLSGGKDSTFYTSLDYCTGYFTTKGDIFRHFMILEGVGFFCNFCGRLCPGGEKTRPCPWTTLYCKIRRWQCMVLNHTCCPWTFTIALNVQQPENNPSMVPVPKIFCFGYRDETVISKRAALGSDWTSVK